MDSRSKRRKKKDAVRETMDLIKTILLVIIAVAVVIFVFIFIKNQLGGSKGDESPSFLSSLLGRETKGGTEAATQAQSTEAETEKTVTDGMSRDDEGNIFFYKDGEALKDMWLDFENGLYRLDKDGKAVTGTFKEGAFIYEMSGGGSVRSISYDHNYRSDMSSEYPGLIETKTIRAYLGKDRSVGRFWVILYKKASESMSHQLGGEKNPQYTGAGSLQTEAGYIYWLPRAENPDETEKLTDGTLYRMLPGSEKREIVAKNVDGYRVVAGENGKTAIYYCSGGQMYKCGPENCREDIAETVFTEDMAYKTEIAGNGKLYLRTASGKPVTKEAKSFNVKGFTYSLSPEGEILSVAENVEVKLGEYTYFILRGEVFGTVRSAIGREGLDGVETVISVDFPGDVRSLYYNEADDHIYGECRYTDGAFHVIKISTDGDVDLLIGGNGSADSMKICAFENGSVIVRETFSGRAAYEAIPVSESVPIALGIEPVRTSEAESEAETASPPDVSGPGGGPGSETTAGPSEGYYLGPGGYTLPPTRPEIGPGMPPAETYIPDEPVTVNGGTGMAP